MNHVPVAPCRVLLRLFCCLAALVPMAAASPYVPDTPNVLARAPLENPGETFALRFTAPATPVAIPTSAPSWASGG